VPPNLLTAERLATRNYEGVSVVRLAEDRGHVAQIPEDARPKSYGPLGRVWRRFSSTRAPF
jgi:hypothetical protein